MNSEESEPTDFWVIAQIQRIPNELMLDCVSWGEAGSKRTLGSAKIFLTELFSQKSFETTLYFSDTVRPCGQDKGHPGEVEAFVEALTKGGKEPIPWEELQAVAMASILAVRSMREGVPFDV